MAEIKKEKRISEKNIRKEITRRIYVNKLIEDKGKEETAIRIRERNTHNRRKESDYICLEEQEGKK